MPKRTSASLVHSIGGEGTRLVLFAWARTVPPSMNEPMLPSTSMQSAEGRVGGKIASRARARRSLASGRQFFLSPFTMHIGPSTYLADACSFHVRDSMASELQKSARLAAARALASQADLSPTRLLCALGLAV